MDVNDLAQMTGGWPIELRFLLWTLREVLGTGNGESFDSRGATIDWDSWLRWVDRHKVSGVLHHRLPEPARASLPPAVAKALRERAMTSVRRSLANAGELSRVVSLFDSRGIRVVALKGLSLSQRLYGELGIRQPGDIDLLVDGADVLAADEVLRESGYRRSYPDFEPTALQWHEFLRIEHELVHRHPNSGSVVELQWRMEGLPDIGFDEIWRCKTQFALLGRTVATLPDDLGSLFLFAHGARHLWFALFWLLDAALLLQTCGDRQAQALWENAKKMGTTKALLQGVALARDLMGVKPPGLLEARLQGQRGLRFPVAEATRRMKREGFRHESIRDFLYTRAYVVWLQDSRQSRLRLLERLLLSPQNWKTLPLPDRCFWLYYPASPFLWAWRRFRRPRPGDVGNRQR